MSVTEQGQIDTALRQWTRYQQIRDMGHSDFVKKADKCNDFFSGDQWNPIDKATLALARRPALTVNKILSTIGNVMGEQIQNRTDISFQPRSGAPGRKFSGRSRTRISSIGSEQTFFATALSPAGAFSTRVWILLTRCRVRSA